MKRFKIVEIGLIVISLGWAVTLLLPSAVFNNPAYMAMANIAPEWVWAIITGMLGIHHVVGWLTKNRRIQQVGLLCATMLWTFVTTMFIMTGANTGVVGYLAFSVMSALLYYEVTNRDA